MSFWKKKDNLIITLCVAIFFIGLAVYNKNCVSADFLAPSTSMNAFQVPFVNENQTQMTLSQFKGKPVVVNLWATWCPVCVKKMGSLNRFAEKFKAKGGEVLAISQDQGGISTVKAYYSRNGYTHLPVYIDSTGSLLNAFRGRGLPTAIFIDAQGNEVGRLEGGLDWDGQEVRQIIDQYFGIKIS